MEAAEGEKTGTAQAQAGIYLTIHNERAWHYHIVCKIAIKPFPL